MWIILCVKKVLYFYGMTKLGFCWSFVILNFTQNVFCYCFFHLRHEQKSMMTRTSITLELGSTQGRYTDKEALHILNTQSTSYFPVHGHSKLCTVYSSLYLSYSAGVISYLVDGVLGKRISASIIHFGAPARTACHPVPRPFKSWHDNYVTRKNDHWCVYTCHHPELSGKGD